MRSNSADRFLGGPGTMILKGLQKRTHSGENIMRSHAIRSLSLFSLCLAVGVSACNKREARGGEAVVAVTDIDLGRSVKSDGTIDDHGSNFRPSDVVYVTVGTKGEGT